MKNKITCAIALLACSTFASADWVGSVNYSHFSDKLGGQDVDLGALGLTAGYRFNIAENIRLVPEVRVGFGIGGDAITTNAAENIQGDFEINDYLGVALRGEYILTEDFYAFAVISYQNTEVKLDAVQVGGQSVPFSSVSNSNTEVGAGVGAGWQINEKNAIELSYEDIDGSDLITVGYRFNF